jgi:hypothetical protein
MNPVAAPKSKSVNGGAAAAAAPGKAGNNNCTGFWRGTGYARTI